MKKINVAVIGCGTIANNSHFPAYKAISDQVEIKYFCDIIPERAEKAAKEYGGEAVFDYKALLDKEDIDAVSVCTPNDVHSEISIAFLKAGKDVLCEKPAARTLEEALEMQKAQKETGRILNIGVCNRFNSSVERIKKLIDDGELGEVFHVYISFRSHRAIPGLGGAFTTQAISGGGVLIDWGVHFIDLVMFCCGDPQPKTVSGTAFSKLGVNMADYTYTDMWAGPPTLGGTYDVDDSVTALIRTEGPTITLNGAWAQNLGIDEMYVDFMGDKAGIRLYYGGGFVMFSAKDGALIKTERNFAMENMYHKEIASFINAVKVRENTTAHIDNAIITSKIMQAIYDSSDEGKEIAL